MTELTLEALIAWLRQQPPDQEYTWQDPAFCLVGRYRAAHGGNWGEVSYSELPHYDEIAQTKPWNMGAALERAEAVKALPPPSDDPVVIAEPLALIEEHPRRIAPLALPAK